MIGCTEKPTFKQNNRPSEWQTNRPLYSLENKLLSQQEILNRTCKLEKGQTLSPENPEQNEQTGKGANPAHWKY